jgi:GxxExxY protein
MKMSGSNADFALICLSSKSVIVECKAKDTLHPVDTAQLISHLRLLKLRVGLLISFHEIVLKEGVKRIVNGYSKD